MAASPARDFLQRLFRTAIAAAHPGTCLPPHLPKPPRGRLIVLAAGKAAGAMTEAVEAACGASPPLPDWLSDLDAREESVTVLPADQAAVERFVLSTSRAAQEGAAA